MSDAAQPLDSDNEKRVERLNLRVTPTESALIRQASERYGSITQFLVESARKEANQALEQDRRTVLSNEVFDRLVERLADEHSEPVEALVELMKRPRRVKVPEV